MLRLQGLIGIVVLLGIAWLLSNNRRRIDHRLVVWGLALQFAFAVIILRTPFGQPAFRAINDTVKSIIDFTAEGTSFLFKPLNPTYEITYEVAADSAAEPAEEPPAADEDQTPAEPQPDNEVTDMSQTSAAADVAAETATPTAEPRRMTFRNVDGRSIAPMVASIAIVVLPSVIFFSALLAVLYHLGIMQVVVRSIAWVMQKTMRTSGAETLSVAGNIFVGQTEAPLLVRPFLKGMTKSELMTVMVGGFATIAGGVLALYVLFLEATIPNIAGHLVAASVMSAPAALVIAKIMYPETEVSETSGMQHIATPRTAGNVMEAFGEGASDGMKLMLNIAAMLLVFVAAVAMINAFLGFVGSWMNLPDLSLQKVLGLVFAPLAWCLGVTWSDAEILGTLLGEKIVLTELIAYQHLSQIAPGPEFSERARIIASYALCGFANFASVGIQMGGISGMVPERKQDISALAMKAMVGGALASWLTASIAGLLL